MVRKEDYAFNMYIKWDEEKMESEGIYKPDEMQKILDEKFKRCGIVKDEQGYYCGNEFASFVWTVGSLLETEWFLNNLKEWSWYNRDNITGQMIKEDWKEYFLNNPLKTSAE